MHPWTFQALQILDDRERHERERRYRNESQVPRSEQPSRVRRSAAIALATLSRGSAAAVRRLDDCVADELGRSLAPSK